MVIKARNWMVLLVIFCTLLFGCKKMDNGHDGEIIVSSNVRLLQSDSDDDIPTVAHSTALITAVPGSLSVVNNNTDLEIFYDRQLQNMVSDSVVLQLPMETPTRLVKATYSTDLTLAEATSGEGNITSIGVSDSFIITSDTDQLSVEIELIPRPTVQEVFPVDQSTDIAIADDIMAVFNQAMNPATVTTNQKSDSCTGNFQLSANGFTTCAHLSDEVTAIDGRTKMLVSPAYVLECNTTYQTKIVRLVQDLYGNDMTSDYLVNDGFTTVTDIASPTDPAVTIEGGANSTALGLVTLNLSAKDDCRITAYYASSSSSAPAPNAAGWVAAEMSGSTRDNTLNTTLFLGDVLYALDGITGSKTLYLWFKDAIGNLTGMASDSIILVKVLLSPNGAEAWRPGSSHQITWESGLIEGAFVKLELVKGGTVQSTIINSVYNDGSYTWTIPAGQAEGSDFKVRITSTSALSNSDLSDSTFTISSSASTTVVLVKVPDTGQTASYTGTAGEDSDYSINPLSYVNNGNGTITDNVTGLIWQMEDDNTERSWITAEAYCSALNLAGYSDWRLPSVKELLSIASFAGSNPAINQTYFTNTDPAGYWSFTPHLNDPGDAWWFVNFGNGSAGTSLYTRCVRGSSNPETWPLVFTLGGDGTAYHQSTGLTWQQTDDDIPRSWDDALTYCEGLSLGGYSDWRLPDIKELHTISDFSRTIPAIDSSIFPGTNAAGYWSSTTHANFTGNAWGVFYDYGGADYINKNSGYLARCVRGGW